MANSSSDSSDFSRLVRYWRRKRYWSQAVLAEKLHVSKATIKNWERGIAQPTLHNRQQLVHILKVSEMDLGLTDMPNQLSDNQVEVTEQPQSLADTLSNLSPSDASASEGEQEVSSLTNKKELSSLEQDPYLVEVALGPSQESQNIRFVESDLPFHGDAFNKPNYENKKDSSTSFLGRIGFNWPLIAAVLVCFVVLASVLGQIISHRDPYIYSFANGDAQGWIAFGHLVTYRGTKDMDADDDGGSFFVRTHLSTVDGQDTTGVAVYFNPADLEGKTASCEIYILTSLPLTSNSNDKIYFRLLVQSPNGQTGHTEYGNKYESDGLQSGQWFTIKMGIRNPPNGPDDDSHFLASQVDALEILLKVDVGAQSQIHDNEFDFYVDDCKIA
jgi:transcriptional regulator with XRE-family HTH domain